MDVAARMGLIRELCSFEGRLAGTDAERRAANRMAERLREGGRDVDVEPIHVHPQYGLVHAAHCALGFAGSLVAIAAPAVGFAIVLATAVSMYLDLNGRVYGLRSLFFRRASQNVLARPADAGAGAGDARRPVVVLCAHLDAPRTGAAFQSARVARAARLAATLRVPVGPFRALFWSLALLLPLLGLRMAGADSGVVSVLQLVPTLVLLAGTFLLVDVELSEVVPGANDNASGVATVLSLADELDRTPPENLDVWVLLTGGEECLQEGMRAFVRSHRRELARESTYFVCVDSVGAGTVRYEVSAGWVVTFAMDRHLIDLATTLAESGVGEPARALRSGAAMDSFPPRARRYAATAITCRDEGDLVPHGHTAADVPENLDGAALERAHEFALGLVALLDRDVGRTYDRVQAGAGAGAAA